MNLVVQATTANKFDIYERSLLIAIARRVNANPRNPADKWWCWPSIETLCNDSCMKKSRLHLTVSSLEGKGVIKHVKGKTGVPNRYKILVEALDPAAKYCVQSPQQAKNTSWIDDNPDDAPF